MSLRFVAAELQQTLRYVATDIYKKEQIVRYGTTYCLSGANGYDLLLLEVCALLENEAVT